MKLKATLTALSLLAAGTAFAQDTGWYGGISVGQSSAKIDEATLDQELRAAGFTHNGIRSEESDTGFKLLLGNRFHKNFAAEASYNRLGSVSAETLVTNTAPNINVKAEVESNQAFALDALVIAPFDRFDVFGRAGAYYAKTKGTASAGGLSMSETDSNTGLHLGLGADYRVTKTVSIRAEAERFFDVGGDSTGGKGDIDLISVGVLFRF
jgi:OOP family OmpA-OmpF porin